MRLTRPKTRIKRAFTRLVRRQGFVIYFEYYFEKLKIVMVLWKNKNKPFLCSDKGLTLETSAQ